MDKIKLIKGADKEQIKLCSRGIDELRNFLANNLEPETESYCVALIEELTMVMAQGRYENGDKWAKDVLRYFKDSMKNLEENKDEVEKMFKESEKEEEKHPKKGLSRSKAPGLGISIDDLKRHGMDEEDIPDEILEILKNAHEVAPGVGAIDLRDVPKDKREKVKKVLEMLNAQNMGGCGGGDCGDDDYEGPDDDAIDIMYG